MILSVSTWSAHPLLWDGILSKEDFVKLIHSYGARGMEVVDLDFHDTSYESMKELQDIGKKYGVEITCMSLEHDLCQCTAEEREADVEKVFRWMDISKKLGVDTVRIFTGWEKEGVPYAEQMEWVYEGLCRIAEKAKELDLTLVLENHNSVCLQADEILDMFKRVQSSNMFTCPDVFNYKKFSGPQIPLIDDECFDEIEKLVPLARNVHIKICEGVNENKEDKYLDITRMIKQLKDHNYDGPLALEFMWPYLAEGKDTKQELINAICVLDYQIRVNN